jgi:tetratricopeptide (TPR) repeat protein
MWGYTSATASWGLGMNHLLKAMGIWIWGLIAIGLSISVVSVSYRLVALYRAHDPSADLGLVDAGAASNLQVPMRSAAIPSARPAVRSDSIVGKDIAAARVAIQSSQWSQAIDDLKAAETKSLPLAQDRTAIYELEAFVYIRLKNFQSAQSAYEAALAAGGHTLQEEAKILRYVFQLATVNEQRTKAIEYGQRITAADAAGPNDLLIMGQLYYQQGDCKNSAAWGDKAIAAYRQTGESPKEVLYQMKLQCSSNIGDSNGMIAALVELIRLTNKPSYWNNLLRIERAEERDPHNTLMIYRLMYDTKSMTVDTDYIEMAQLLGDAGLPEEARAVLKTAMSSSLIKDEHKERVDRLWRGFSARADADSGATPRAGRPFDEAIILQARSEVTLRKYPQAVRALSELNQIPGFSSRISMLWTLYAETLGAKT